MKRISLISILLLTIHSILFAGFSYNTPVKTGQTYTLIQDIQINDYVDCIDESNTITQKPVTHIKKTSHTLFVRIYCNDIIIETPPQQLFYATPENIWKTAYDLTIQDSVYTYDGIFIRIAHIETIEEQKDFYDLSLDDVHNFFITPSGVLVHNFIVLPVLLLEGFIQSVGIATAFFSAKLLNECFLALSKKNQDKKKAQAQKIIEDNNKSDNQNNNGNNRPPKRDKPDNKEIRKWAALLGFVETKDYNFDSHGQLVFRLGRRYISYDIDGHLGGYWKLLNKFGARVGTYTRDLVKKLGT